MTPPPDTPLASDDLFRLVVEAAPNAMLMVARDGTITLVNARTEELFGYRREQLLGSKVEMLVPEAFRAGHPKLRDGFFARPSVRRMAMGSDRVLYGVTSDGTEVPVEIGLNPIETSSGNFVLASVIDISQRLEAEERVRTSEARFRRVVEAAPNAIVMVSPAGRISLVNQQAETLFGHPREALLDQPLEMLLPPRTRDHHPGLRRRYMDNPESRPMGRGRDLFGLRKGGQEVPIEIGLNPIETEDGIYVLASIIDITERKRAEQAQLKLNRTLELQVEETQRALQQLQVAQNHLVQSEKLASLGGLVAGVSHEVNTPVGVGVTAASHLYNEVRDLREAVKNDTLTRAQFEKYLDAFEQSSDIILRNLRRAADLISSFKQVAVDQSTEERRIVPLRDYISEVLLSLKPKLKGTQHGVEFECRADARIRTMPGALSQILTNLFVNALTHAFDAQDAGTISITLEPRDTHVQIRFADDGRGIAQEHLSRIFDPFYTTRRGQGGTGLGLNIVYNLVNRTLGGTIDVDSTLGAGTSFTITLPIEPGDDS